MTRKDIFHDAVRHALEKDGWTITHDPLTLQVGGVDMYIDLGAERLIAAEKDGEKIEKYTIPFSFFHLFRNLFRITN